MKSKYKLKHLIFFALCCDLGLFSKRLIGPAANLITDALHIPGGVGTAFSLLFLVVGASVIPVFGCAVLMGTVQSVIAVSFGMVGSMGILSPIGYIIPGFVIDIALWTGRKTGRDTILLSNLLASVAASLCANAIVFHLRGTALLLYCAVAGLSGGICGCLAQWLYHKIEPVMRKGYDTYETEKEICADFPAACADGSVGSPAPDHP